MIIRLVENAHLLKLDFANWVIVHFLPSRNVPFEILCVDDVDYACKAYFEAHKNITNTDNMRFLFRSCLESCLLPNPQHSPFPPPCRHHSWMLDLDL